MGVLPSLGHWAVPVRGTGSGQGRRGRKSTRAADLRVGVRVPAAEPMVGARNGSAPPARGHDRPGSAGAAPSDPEQESPMPRRPPLPSSSPSGRPCPRRCGSGRRRRRTTCAATTAAGGGPRSRPPRRPTTASCSTTTRRRGRTRARAASPRACTASPAGSTRTPTSGATAPGPAGRSPAASSTSCTSARSRPRARSTPRSAGWATWSASGVDFVELLPVNAFNGTHNWGYDGVLWYAVQETYGGPAAYQRFVDACHQQGLGVIQDVVYNHLGPSGNYLPEFFPIFAEGGANTWGNSINLSRPRLRRGAPLHHRQRADVAAGHARRRAAAGRRPRAGRRAGHPRARGDGRRRWTSCRSPSAGR